ncbi:MAG TPA: flippase activity-associated protein Agl23 [Anaerolineales bacterium]|nr:flippase activity-associated protein Agl23 [Anaerolineales bacterium]
MSETNEKRPWLDRPVLAKYPRFTGEMLIFSIIILLGLLSRLYNLGQRVMSHDENLHVYFSWLFSQGQGYMHSPLMHGPLLFHLTALTFFLMGATDFSARFPQAIASILTIALLWNWRRYLGKAGTLVAAVLLVISPYMLFYGRYARNEAFVALFGVLTLYSILRYFETGRKRYLALLTVATALHFTSKETAFIYTAQAMLFLGVYLVNRVTRKPWKSSRLLNGFVICLALGVLVAGSALGLSLYNRGLAAPDASQTAAPSVPGQLPGLALAAGVPLVAGLVVASIILFIAALILLINGYGWGNLRQERSFEMLVLLGTFVLPQLAAFPANALGWDPLDYAFKWPGWNFSALLAQPPVKTLLVFLVLVILSVAIGLIWGGKRWLGYAAIFWGIYIVFYTTVFSNWQGFFTGTVGSLGYWLQQQGVRRGNQPWYYYILIQIPVYEFLPALGLLLAAYFGFRQKSPAPLPADSEPNPVPDGISEGNYTFPLLFWWALSSLAAFTVAGEKMPWLTVHIVLPMILLTGWAVGQLIERADWTTLRKLRLGWVTILLVVFFTSLGGFLVQALGSNRPFQGKTIGQLAQTNAFLLTGFILVASAVGLFYLLSRWQLRQSLRIAGLVFFGLLAVLTGRAAFRAAFVDYNDPTEYLVYAHGATGIKDVMDQIADISYRTTGGNNLQIAYDANMPDQGVEWSFKWYLRNYPNATLFDKPDTTLQNDAVIIVDQKNFDNIKPIVGDNYFQFDYIRMVWPNQDYFGLTWPRLKNAITNPAMREAIFQIWYNRDYSEYASVTGESGLTLANWSPSNRMELFIRKDVADQMWEYGIVQQQAAKPDPYLKGIISPSADTIVETSGDAIGAMNAPRGVTIAPDGTLYVADSRNNRIVHLDALGKVINVIGAVSPGCPYQTVPPADVPLGTFCEPWAVAVSPDGTTLYVADTWNHRIQKLAADGTPIKAWGTPNYDPIGTGPFGLWGPRGIAVDASGRVFVADTGNKRIVIYDSDGNFVTQFGGGGIDVGQLEEPVGLAFDSAGNLYVADTWNQRIQVFAPDADRTTYTSTLQWEIAGWTGESLDNKPYLAVDQQGHVFATDPESFRVLEFTTDGQFIHTWGDFGTGPDKFGLTSGIAVDAQGRIWVSDTANNRLMRFTLP